MGESDDMRADVLLWKEEEKMRVKSEDDDCSCQKNLSTQVHCVLVFCYDNV